MIQLPAKPVEEPKERKKSPRDRRDNDKFSLRRNRDRPDHLDRPDHHDRPDCRDKNQDNWRNKNERNKNERTKRDFNKPSSGFVRGKGRGKELEGRNFDKTGHKDRNNRKDEREREVNKIENKKSTGSENTEDERLRLDTKTKSVEIPDDNKTKNSKAENDPVPSEQQDKEQCKPRFDEKINDRHKTDSVEKMTDRTSEYSSHMEDITGAAGSSHETVKCDFKTIEIDTLATQTNDEMNESKHDYSKDENVTGNKQHTGRGGFGKPPSDSKGRRDSQTKSENPKNVNAKGNESHKGCGGFRKPLSDSKDSTDSQTKGVNSKNSEAKSNNRHGGFGKPPSDSKDRTDNQIKSENPKNIDAKSNERHKGSGGFGKPPFDSYEKTDSQTKSENPKNIDAKSNEQNKGRGGFGKPPSDIKGGETESPDHDRYKTNNKPLHQDNRTKSNGKYKEHYDRSSNRKEIFHDKRDKQFRDKYESKKNYDRYDKSKGQRSDDDKYGRVHSSSDKVGDRFYNAHEKHDVDSDHLLDKRSDRNHGRHRQDKFDKKLEKNPSYSDIKHNDQGFDRKRHSGGFGKPGFDNRRNERDRYHSDHVQSRNKDIDHKPELWEDTEPNEKVGTDIKTEGQKPSGGFGKPNSNKKSKEMIERNCDDWKDKEIGSELRGKGETHEDRNSQRARGGYGRPNPRRKSCENDDDSNWNEIDKYPDNRNPKKENRDSFDERPRGGFGRPNSEFERPNSGFETKRLDFNQKDDNALQKPRNDLKNERPYSRHDRRPETKRNDRRKDYRNDQRNDYRNDQRNDYRHDQRNDHKKDNRFDYRNDRREENRHDYRNDNRHDHRDDYRKESRHDNRKDHYKDIDDNDKNERLAGSSKSDSHNWRENRTQPKDDEAGKHNKHSKADNRTHVDGGSQGDFYTREDSSFKNKENDRKCDSGASEIESRTENVIRRNCDTKTDCKTDMTSHPPGFKVGPPPGFHKETKSAESIKPPPGF